MPAIHAEITVVSMEESVSLKQRGRVTHANVRMVTWVNFVRKDWNVVILTHVTKEVVASIKSKMAITANALLGSLESFVRKVIPKSF